MNNAAPAASPKAANFAGGAKCRYTRTINATAAAPTKVAANNARLSFVYGVLASDRPIIMSSKNQPMTSIGAASGSAWGMRLVRLTKKVMSQRLEATEG